MADPDAVRRVWAFTSPDGRAWTRGPEPVAWNLESLGLQVDADTGELIVTGVVHHRIERPPWERLLGPPIRGLRFDGARWAPWRRAGVDGDALAYIDPQPFEDTIWYMASASSAGDPMAQGRELSLRSGPPATLHYAAAGIADPSPVRINGEIHVFATARSVGERAAFEVHELAGSPLKRQARITGVAVPFVVSEDQGVVHLVAQQIRDGLRQPVQAHFDASAPPPAGDGGRRRVSWRPLLDGPALAGLASCTSPVMGAHPAGGWMLLCVEELDAPGGEGTPRIPEIIVH